MSHLLVEEEKMSKSLGNFYTLNDLLKEGRNPLSIRYMLISTHYRNNYNFTFKGIDAADKTIAKVNRFIKVILEKKNLPSNEANNHHLEAIAGFENSFKLFLCDDLNISASLGVFYDFINFVNKNLEDFTKSEYEEIHPIFRKGEFGFRGI